MSDATRHAESGGRRSRALTLAEFDAAMAKHYPSLIVVAAAAGGRDRAEDIVQDAALIALRKIRGFSRGTNFGAWMATIVRNVASNTVRSDRRRVARERRVREGGGTAQRGATADRSGSARRVEELLNSLNPQQRECLMLRVALSRSYDEIAAIMSIPPATARSHVLRARRRLLQGVTAEERGNA